VVDSVDQLPGNLLQHAEIEDEQTLSIDGTLDRHADPVVVAVERFALVALEGDEVGGCKDEVVLADLNAEVALHGGSPNDPSHPLV